MNKKQIKEFTKYLVLKTKVNSIMKKIIGKILLVSLSSTNIKVF